MFNVVKECLMFFGNNSFDGICSYLFAQKQLGHERIAYKLIFHWLDPYSDGQLRMGAGWKPRWAVANTPVSDFLEGNLHENPQTIEIMAMVKALVCDCGPSWCHEWSESQLRLPWWHQGSRCLCRLVRSIGFKDQAAFQVSAHWFWVSSRWINLTQLTWRFLWQAGGLFDSRGGFTTVHHGLSIVLGAPVMWPMFGWFAPVLK